MLVVGRKKLTDFMKRHPQARAPLQAWLTEAIAASWKMWADVKTRYPNADLVRDGKVVFNIKGNSFRLVVLVSYAKGVLVIDRVGTHAEYSKWTL